MYKYVLRVEARLMMHMCMLESSILGHGKNG